MNLTKEQRSARDGLSFTHLASPSVEQFLGAVAKSAPYGTLFLRFEKPNGGIPAVYMIDQEGRVAELTPWP